MRPGRRSGGRDTPREARKPGSANVEQIVAGKSVPQAAPQAELLDQIRLAGRLKRLLLITVSDSSGEESSIAALKKDARVAQLIFFHTGEVSQGYNGVYQRERMK